MDAMDQFLDDSIVLPPGDWDQDLILPLMHQRNEIKRSKGLHAHVYTTCIYTCVRVFDKKWQVDQSGSFRPVQMSITMSRLLKQIGTKTGPTSGPIRRSTEPLIKNSDVCNNLNMYITTERKEEEMVRHHDDENAIKHSRKLCGGILRDLKTLCKRYPSDFKDIFHVQALLALLFVYISCVAPAIAFGGIMEEVTLNSIGATETLVGTGICGIVYGLLGVQPLTILAFIGPLLLFEEIIIEVQLCVCVCYQNSKTTATKVHALGV